MLRLEGLSGAGCDLEKNPAFPFGEPSPNPVRLFDAKGVVEALLAHLAARANRLGTALPLELIFLAFRSAGRIKDVRIGAATRCSNLPWGFLYLCAHTSSFTPEG